MIFFDEIHQGSGTDSMQENTIKFFYDKEYSPHKVILIMVTATYAKPLAKYGREIDGEDCTLVECNYEMIMKMKSFEIENVTINDDKSNYLIDFDDTDFESKMKKLKSITEELNVQGKTCQDIAGEYVNNPELAYLLPTLKDKYKDKNKEGLMDEDYNITEDNGEEENNPKINIKNNLKEIFTLNPGSNRTFKYKNSVNKLLSYIYEYVYNELLEKTYDFVANGEGDDFHSQLWFMPTSLKNMSKKNKEENMKEDRAIVGPMLKNFGLAIINHPKFINFNVCVVHSGQESEKNEIISTFDKDKENPRKLYFQCITSSKYKGNVKNCIRDIENKSKESNKSVVFLTAQRLRLGISLPCVDVAIHMDDIKSYDIIYQSMFRVLTERPNKKRGYFVDMVLDRAIQFFYKYTKKTKKDKKIEDITKDEVRKNLLLFDVGSVRKSIGFTKIEEPINSYSEIAENFRIDKEKKFEQYRDEILKNKEDEDNDEDDFDDEDDVSVKSKEEEIDSKKETEKNKKNVIKLLNDLYEDETVKDELKQIIKSLNVTKGQSLKNDTKTKKQEEPFKDEVELPNKTKKDEDELIISDENTRQLFKDIVEQIKNTFTLLILFDDNDKTLESILKLDDLDINKITDCDDPEIMYYCYLISTIDNINKIGDVVEDKQNNKRGVIENIFLTNDKKEYKIKFDDETVDDYDTNKFKKYITNLSIPNNFDLKEMDGSFVKKYIEKNVRLIEFLLDKEQNEELNNLFNNIKREMKNINITEKLNNEKLMFKNNSLDVCPEDFIGNEKVLDIIRKYLTPKESEKKLFGEVFTPLNLICEMLSKLPSKVWSNKDLKWLDPANGIGNFPIVVYYKLMEGLKDEIKNEEKRSNWIIENMIYMNELNPVNVALSKKVFKMIDPKSTPNIVKADFITDYNKVLKKMRDDTKDEEKLFDIIIGNPPYNSLTSTGDNKPYLTFTFISLSILEKNGFLSFITPPPIYDYLFKQKVFKITRDLYTYDKLLNIVYINADNNYLKKFFRNVGSEFSYFVIENKEYKGKTHILYEKENVINEKIIDASKMTEISNEINIIKELYNDILDSEYVSIKNKIFGSKNEIFEFKKAMFGNSTRRIRKEQIEQGIVTENKTDTHKYKIIESYKIEKGDFKPKIYYIDKTDNDYDKKRLIVSGGPSNLYPYIIAEKSYTLSDNIYYTLCNNNNDCNNLLFFLDSPLWKYIDKKYRPSTSINSYLISLIEQIKPLPSHLFKTNEELYNFFHLTKNEIFKIEEHTKEKISKTRKNIKSVLKNSATKSIEKTVKKHKKTKKLKDKKGGRKKTRKHKSIFKLW